MPKRAARASQACAQEQAPGECMELVPPVTHSNGSLEFGRICYNTPIPHNMGFEIPTKFRIQEKVREWFAL